MLDDVTARHEKRGHAIKRGSRHLKRLKLLLCFYFLNYILWYRGNNQYWKRAFCPLRVVDSDNQKNYTMYKTRYREALFEMDINLVDIENKKAIT